MAKNKKHTNYSNKKLDRFINNRVDLQPKDKKELDYFYSYFVFRDTEELKRVRTIVQSRTVKNNAMAIILSLLSFGGSFYLWLSNYIMDTGKEIAIGFCAVMMLYCGMLYVAVSFIDGKLRKDEQRYTLIVEVIDRILSEREENL